MTGLEIAALIQAGSALFNGMQSGSGGWASDMRNDLIRKQKEEMERMMRQRLSQNAQSEYDKNKPDYSNFLASMPDPSKYFSTDTVNKNYDTALQNLNRLMGSKMGSAAKMAGEQAAARGMTNPGGYMNQATQGVQDAFAPQFGQLEASRANATQDMMGNLYNSLFGQKQMQLSTMQNPLSNSMDLQKLLYQIQLGG